MRNSFIVGCEQEADKVPAFAAQYDIPKYCECGYDKLKEFYGDKFNNEYFNKVIAEGYSQEDIQLISSCLVRR